MIVRTLAVLAACTSLCAGAPVAPAAPAPAGTGGSVVFALSSSRDQALVAPGTRVDWSIDLVVSAGDNLGLALVSVDLTQAATNPEPILLQPGRAVSAMMRDFDRPRGFPNPGPRLDLSGFGGTPLDGATRLVQIGGAQNTFGSAPACLGPNGSVCMGQDLIVDTGVGQGPGPLVLAHGSFRAPATPGTYVVRLEGLRAHTLSSVQAPPLASGVRRAQVGAPRGSISFRVQ